MGMSVSAMVTGVLMDDELLVALRSGKSDDTVADVVKFPLVAGTTVT
jgi:hypothetical protein